MSENQEAITPAINTAILDGWAKKYGAKYDLTPKRHSFYSVFATIPVPKEENRFIVEYPWKCSVSSVELYNNGTLMDATFFIDDEDVESFNGFNNEKYLQQ